LANYIPHKTLMAQLMLNQTCSGISMCACGGKPGITSPPGVIKKTIKIEEEEEEEEEEETYQILIIKIISI
jgi:hypothetical protein